MIFNVNIFVFTIKGGDEMGGMFGNNSAGERTLKYGQTDAWVLESKVVFADGNEYTVKSLSKTELKQKISQNDFEGSVYKKLFELIKNNEDEIKLAKPTVSKNSSGYYLWNIVGPEGPKIPSKSEGYFNLNKLLVGSQGTLGITTEITFKVIPQTKNSKLVVVFMNDLAPLGRLVDEILLTNPETLETYDDKTLHLAVKFVHGFLKNRGIGGIIKLFFSFLPEFLMVLSSPWRGLPKLVILAEYAGSDEKEVEGKCLDLKKKIASFKLKTHITKNSEESEKYWSIRRESFALLRSRVEGKHTAPFIDDIIVRPEFLPKFLPELNMILNQYDIMYTIAGHAGDGNFHIIPLMDFKKQNVAQIILELSDKVYDLVMRYHGSMAAEHNDGIVRTPYLQKMFSSRMNEIFRSTKEIFDPKNIFNPGKKVPVEKNIGTKEYIFSHITKS
jgi:FAD/FMN-containing dehydrogenase